MIQWTVLYEPKDTTYYKTQQQSNMESIKIKVLYSIKTNSLFDDFFFLDLLRVCVLWNRYLIRFLYPGRCRRTDKDVIKLLVLNFFVHTLQTIGFGYVSWVVVFPSGVPGKRSGLGESWQMRSRGHARVGPCSWRAPASVWMSQHFALTCTCPETCGKQQCCQDVMWIHLLAHLVEGVVGKWQNVLNALWFDVCGAWLGFKHKLHCKKLKECMSHHCMGSSPLYLSILFSFLWCFYDTHCLLVVTLFCAHLHLCLNHCHWSHCPPFHCPCRWCGDLLLRWS